MHRTWRDLHPGPSSASSLDSSRGGLYIIEDWQWEVQVANALADVLTDRSGSGDSPVSLQTVEGFGRQFMTALADQVPDSGAAYEDQLASILAFMQSSTPDDHPLTGGLSSPVPAARWVDRRPLSDMLYRVLL